MKFTILSLAVTAVLALDAPVHGAAGDPLDLQTRYPHYYASYVINEDGTAVESREWSRTVLKERALQWSRRASITYSTSAQKAEVVEAFTKKADGRHIDVPPDNYQVDVNRGKGKDSPVYSDFTTMTVVFPDVSVGDTVVLSYRLVQTVPLFPKQFSTTESYSQDVPYDDVRVRFDYPAQLWVQYEARKMTEASRSESGGRKTIEWRYANPAPIKDDRQNYSVYDPDAEVGYSFSTFKSYDEIAAAYGERANPKAAVTDRVKKLASEIVKDRRAQKDQARALYDWVATNIGYAGNCIGIGAVVPRNLSFVLDNKIGDCKDHATLLQALLSARGIKSTQVLINAGSTYKLPKIPVVSTVNHVINYIPSLDLYVDSTSSATPFGMLPFNDQDKTVLWVEGYKDGTKTPVPAVGANSETIKTVFTISGDGSAHGTAEAFQTGSTAAESRAWARQLTKDYEEDLVKNMLRGQGMIGSGQFEKDDPTALSDVYHFKLSFTSEKFIKLPGAGAFYLYSPPRPSGAIQQFLQFTGEVEKHADVACRSGRATEEYVLELPKDLQVLSLPDDVKLGNALLRFTASYRLKDNVLTATRTLDDRTRGSVCSAQYAAEYKEIGDAVMEDLKSQVLYKLAKKLPESTASH